jgi:hypothetical protein
MWWVCDEGVMKSVMEDVVEGMIEDVVEDMMRMRWDCTRLN